MKKVQDCQSRKIRGHLQEGMGFPGGSVLQNSPANAGNKGLIPRVCKSPWKRKSHPTQVFLPGNTRGERKQAGYSLWDHKELDMTY